jgi:biotin synthase-like enzyme
VLQSGEDPYYSASDIARIVDRIKDLGDVAVTLSVGKTPNRQKAV